MKTYYFQKDRNGKLPSLAIGTGLEECIKFSLGKKHADRLSPAGRSDFKMRYNYDVKQNATPIKYGDLSGYIYGSSRVIYATHVAYEIIREDDNGYEIFIDLARTDLWVVDKEAFVKFLLETKGFAKDNPSRNQINIQTIWNYSKNAYHGAKYKVLEAWLDANRLIDDTIVEDILDGFYNCCM